MSLSVTLSSDDQTKLKNTIREAIKVKQELKDLTDGLKDVIKNVSEELDIPAKLINKAITIEFKRLENSQALEEAVEELDSVGEILEIARK